jgi:hypothetical protein
MDTSTLICNITNITYNKGYIALWCEDYVLPETFVVDGDKLHKKDHFHVSLLCVKNILEVKPDSEAAIIQHFCDFVKNNEVQLEGFTGEFRIATREERKSVVGLCTVSNLHEFAEYLSNEIGIEVAPQPAHVTLYTLQHNMGIGLNSTEELEEKSKIIDVPDYISLPLTNKFDGESVKFIETSQVKEGVVCDVYSFDNDDSKDLGLVRVSKGHKTPLQKVLNGDKTIEIFREGQGVLRVVDIDGNEITHNFPSDKKDVEVKIGEIVQWEAVEDLTFVEICYPPYQEGRFENIDD